MLPQIVAVAIIIHARNENSIERGNPDFDCLVGLSNCTFEFDKQVQVCIGILE